MKIGFTGDLSYCNAEMACKDLEMLSSKIGANLVVNLETPFGKMNFKSIKPKNPLYQSSDFVTHLKSINPYLVNLSNNHINDQGNDSVDFTKELLSNNKINFFGAGLLNENHNVFVDRKNKIVFLSYTERDTEETMSHMFNTDNFKGPKRYSEELFSKQIEDYKNYMKIVLIHWGAENVDMPSPNQRITGREIIDLGADLVIGNHSHRVQGYEKYNDKYIFYSLGNFYFPNHYKKSKKNKRSILPIFEISKNSIELKEIKQFNFTKDKINITKEINLNNYNKYFFLSAKDYKRIYTRHILLRRFM